MFNIEIFTDSSLTGWGACCNKNKTHGFWDDTDKHLHINFLELKAIFFGLKCFASNLLDCNILLRCDNTTAISYINRMGSIQHQLLNSLTREIWQWCEQRSLWIFASYISSKDNFEADAESRNTSSETEWTLSHGAFQVILNHFSVPEVDLFASQINHKCDKYVSWRRDPGSFAVDAFTLNWQNIYFYAFPPFNLVLRTLRKIIQDKAEGILVVPHWVSQPWYPLFSKLIVGQEIYFKPSPDLLFSPFRETHPLSRQLTLVAARLSGSHSSEETFLNAL